MPEIRGDDRVSEGESGIEESGERNDATDAGDEYRSPQPIRLDRFDTMQNPLP